ncbi:MAG: amidohydrolase family protein [Thermodesulfobacteriota bacterium]|nr:amidohydrolase family protein [Thermodesulfobacteriota bacterium]
MNCIYTAKYLVAGNAPHVEGGALLAHEGQIAAIGTLDELKRNHPGIEVVDFADALLVPLLVNAHTHLELTDFPSWAANAGEGDLSGNFIGWVLHLIRVKRKLDEKQYQLSLSNGIDQSIAAGTGAVGDILAHHAARYLYQNSPLVGSLFLETLGQDPAVICRSRAGLNEALKDEVVGSIELGLSPHSPYSISKDYLRSIYAHCQRDKLRCTTHLAESPDEVEFIEHSRGDMVRRFYLHVGWESYIPPPSGLRPVEYLQQQGGLFPENLLVHGVQLNDAEIEVLAENRMWLALCPRSNARLGVGKAPAGKLHRAGVRLALGTDSLASCDSLSVWDEMTFAYRWFDGELDAPTLFSMATLGGAEALGLENSIGSLETGKSASFQVLQPKAGIARNEIFDYFISSHCTDDIIHVYHCGQPQLSPSD